MEIKHNGNILVGNFEDTVLKSGKVYRKDLSQKLEGDFNRSSKPHGPKFKGYNKLGFLALESEAENGKPVGKNSTRYNDDGSVVTNSGPNDDPVVDAFIHG